MFWFVNREGQETQWASETDLRRDSEVGLLAITMKHGHPIVFVSLCRDFPCLENNERCRRVLFSRNNPGDACDIRRGLDLK